MEDELLLEQVGALFEFDKRIRIIEDNQAEIIRLVRGDPGLRVKSLRETVDLLEETVESQQTFIDRLKWVLGTLGLTNTGTIIALVSELIK